MGDAKRYMKIASVVVLTCAVIAGCSGDETRGDSHEGGASAAGTVMSAAEFSSATKYLGIRYDSLPPAFTFVAGALLPGSSGAGAAGFDLDLVRTPRGNMLWLDSIVAVSPRGRPSRVVRAELKVPPLAADERLMMSTCDVDGHVDPRVVAIVVIGPGVAQFPPVRQAWRANATTGVFDVIPVTGIACGQTESSATTTDSRVVP
jgi:hypothetical protein